eukprot:4252642-Pleurochrysis_carterae.AAC.2
MHVRAFVCVRACVRALASTAHWSQSRGIGAAPYQSTRSHSGTLGCRRRRRTPRSSLPARRGRTSI